MSIYKKPKMFWERTKECTLWTQVLMAKDMIYHIMRCSPKDWFSAQDFYNIFGAKDNWQQDCLCAALRHLKAADCIRISDTGKMQYKLTEERS